MDWNQYKTLTSVHLFINSLQELGMFLFFLFLLLDEYQRLLNLREVYSTLLRKYEIRRI